MPRALGSPQGVARGEMFIEVDPRELELPVGPSPAEQSGHYPLRFFSLHRILVYQEEKPPMSRHLKAYILQWSTKNTVIPHLRSQETGEDVLCRHPSSWALPHGLNAN